MNTNKLVVIGIVLALLLGGYGAFKKSQTVYQTTNTDGTQTLGAVPTLDGVDAPCMSLNGVRTCNLRQQMMATSSYVCRFQNMLNATATIKAFSAQIASSTGLLGTVKFTLSTTTSSTGYGSSTPSLLLEHSLTGGQQDQVSFVPNTATTSPGLLPGTLLSGQTTALLAPNEWLTYGYSTTTAAGALAAYPVGVCKAVIQAL